MAEQNYYVVMVDLAFLGIHVEAATPEEAREKAMILFDDLEHVPENIAGIEAGIRNVTIKQVEEEDGTGGSIVLKLLS